MPARLWILIVGACFLLGSVPLLFREIVRERQAARTVRRMRTTAVYTRIAPMLKRCRNDCLESVSIRPGSLALRVLYPESAEHRFTYSKHGMDHLTKSTLAAMREAVASALPALCDPEHYDLLTHGSGEETWYEYVIRPPWKDQVIRTMPVPDRLSAMAFNFPKATNNEQK